MKVSEMIEWLKTQDQEAVVQVVVDDRELDFDPNLAKFSTGTSMGGKHWFYFEYAGKKTLTLGES